MYNDDVYFALNYRGVLMNLSFSKEDQEFQQEVRTFIEQNYPSEIKAVLGPSIGKCCFDIGRDVVQYFSQENLQDFLY